MQLKFHKKLCLTRLFLLISAFYSALKTEEIEDSNRIHNYHSSKLKLNYLEKIIQKFYTLIYKCIREILVSMEYKENDAINYILGDERIYFHIKNLLNSSINIVDRSSLIRCKIFYLKLNSEETFFKRNIRNKELAKRGNINQFLNKGDLIILTDKFLRIPNKFLKKLKTNMQEISSTYAKNLAFNI